MVPFTLRIGASALLLVSLTGTAFAATFTDDFAAGLDPLYWTVEADPPFNLDDSQGDVRLARSQGGEYTLQAIHVKYRGTAQGDFDVSVVFRDAVIDQVDGLPGNQVQLNARFGGQLFALVRSDEPTGGGHNHHVFLSPPNVWVGAMPDASTEGVMRIRRTGSVVEASIHGVPFYSGLFNAEPTTDLSFTLQSNETVDAISVTFDDFSLSADLVTATEPSPLPSPIAVLPPWPSPTGGPSRLAFELAGPQAIRIGVYDLRGRLVRKLLQGWSLVGLHSVVWDGKDARGQTAAAGVYLYRITSGTQRESQRVVVLR